VPASDASDVTDAAVPTPTPAPGETRVATHVAPGPDAPAPAPDGRPPAGPPRPYHFPRFARRTLPNGLRLVVAEVRRLPVVSAVAVVDAGAVCDPAGRDGLALLAARALTEGTATMDAVQLTQRLESLGTALDAGADWDATIVSLTAMADRFPDAVAVLAEVLMAPAFPERELERLKAERLADLLQLQTEPRGLADEMFARFAYADGSRFGRPDGGSATSVPTITRDDVVRFHAERFRPGATTLVVAGDVSLDEVARLAEQAFGGWQGAAAPAPAVDDRPATRERRVHLVAKADAPQSELRVGHVAVPRGTPDYFPLVVMNAILGGLFNSRVNMNLREEHAYTYGAHSSFDWRRAAGPFLAWSAVQSDVTAAAARELVREIERIREEPVRPEELSLATSYLEGVFPIRYETTSAIASALASLVLYGLPEDYFDAYRDRVRAVTAADVQQAAARHLHADALQLVVVGDPAAVRGSLEALAFGELRVWDADGRPM
jgi:predicted Zn-dependent peptidase